MIPVGNRNLLKGLFFLPKRNTTWKETPLSFHAIVFLSQASLEQQKLLVLGVSHVVFFVFQDACSKGQHIDIVVPMTHQLIDDDRLLAVSWRFGQVLMMFLFFSLFLCLKKKTPWEKHLEII